MLPHRTTKLLLALTAAACLKAQGATGDSAQGKAQWTKTCAFCHGPDATGGAEGPNLMLSQVVRHDHNGELIGAVIRAGRPDKGMPAFSLGKPEIDNLVAFLHARLKENDVRSPKRPKDFAVQLLLTGNAKQGEAFFAQHCTGCHSAQGDLKGIASRLEPTDLQAAMLYPGKLPSAVTITTPDGQIKGTLLYRDAFTVEITDASGRYHSWAPDTVKIEVQDPREGHKRLLPLYTEASVHNLFAYLETLH